MKRRKLRLSSETLRVLSESQARGVVGGQTEEGCATEPTCYEATCPDTLCETCADTCADTCDCSMVDCEMTGHGGTLSANPCCATYWGGCEATNPGPGGCTMPGC